MNIFTKVTHYKINCSEDLRVKLFAMLSERGGFDVWMNGASGPRLDSDYRVVPDEFVLELDAVGEGVRALESLLRGNNAHMLLVK